MTDTLKDYVEKICADSSRVSTFSPEEKLTLKWLERETHTRTNHAQMLVGEQEGAFLYNFTFDLLKSSLSHTFRVLEIGTFTGYSLLCFAFAMKNSAKNCSLEALEINDELQYLIEQAIERGGVEDFVSVHFCDAIKYLKERRLSNDTIVAENEKYDLIFIDANKREYPIYYPYSLANLKRGGYILVDNVNWYGLGKSAESEKSAESVKSSKTEGVVALNLMIENDTKNHLIQSYLLNIRDGLYIIKKL